MANRITVNCGVQLTTPGGTVPLSWTLGLDQTGTNFDRISIDVSAEVDGWTQWTKPTDMADVYLFALLNPSDNSNKVNYALSAAATNQPSEIPAGAGILLFSPDATELYFSHLGATSTTQPVEIFAIET